MTSNWQKEPAKNGKFLDFKGIIESCNASYKVEIGSQNMMFTAGKDGWEVRVIVGHRVTEKVIVREVLPVGEFETDDQFSESLEKLTNEILKRIIATGIDFINSKSLVISVTNPITGEQEQAPELVGL